MYRNFKNFKGEYLYYPKMIGSQKIPDKMLQYYLRDFYSWRVRFLSKTK